MIALVGDIGGTNARFALADGERLIEPKSFKSRDYPNALAVLEAYLETAREKPDAISLAVAGPVRNGEIHFTNLGWTLSEDMLRAHGFSRALLLNDFRALAFAAPLLNADDTKHIGGPDNAQGSIAIVGAGTGFGVAALARDGAAEMAVGGEGGHVGFAPGDEIEIGLLRRLSAKWPRVSVERILSGPGLADLHAALAEIDGRAAEPLKPEEITARALAGEAVCGRTVDRFCAILGSVAGDTALVFGATGGVLIGGGIAQALAARLPETPFRQRFEAKGRFAGYMAAIPARVIVAPHAALLGAARALGTSGSA